MGAFEYTAIDGQGQRITGTLAGASAAAVSVELESRRLVPVRVRELRAGPRLQFAGRPSARVLATFYRELGDLLDAGVPLVRSLRLLSSRKTQNAVTRAVRTVRERVNDGEALAEAMAEHPSVFPDVHVAMLRAGERGGFLDQACARLAEMVELQAELRAKVLGSLIYPVVLVSVGALVLGLIFGVFVPRFEPLFERLDELPWITTLVFSIAAAVTEHGLIVFALLAASIVALTLLSRRPDVAYALARLRLRVPVIGPVLRAMSTARFCRLLGTMEVNGVPLLHAMSIAGGAAGNPVMRDAIADAADAIREGENLSEPLTKSGLFDDGVCEVIAVGESAGRLGEVLLRSAKSIEGRVERLLTIAVRLIEPLLLLVLASAIALVAAALVLPMMQLGSTV